MKCLQKQNILHDQPVHGSLNMISLQRLSIFIHQYTSPFERKFGRLTTNSKKMADICLRFIHLINIAYHVIPSSGIVLSRIKRKNRRHREYTMKFITPNQTQAGTYMTEML